MTENNSYKDPEIHPSEDQTEISFPRRKFIQAAGGVAAAGFFSVGASETARGDQFHTEFADRRVREAKKAWDKGFRGQANRTLGVLADGLEARHPDIGPWNGIRAVPDGEKGLELVHENLERLDVPDDIRFFAESRLIPPNAGNIRHEYPFTSPRDADRVEAHLFADPSGGPANGLRLLLETANGDVIDEQTGHTRHSGVAGRIDPKKDYVLAVETTTIGNFVSTSYFLETQYFSDNSDGQTDPFAKVNQQNITADTPKVIGWYNEDFEFSEPTAKPRAGPHLRGHGTFLASVMAGSGRGCTIDETTVIDDAPQDTLLPRDVLTYRIEAEPDRGVYGVGVGTNIEVKLVGPSGERLDHDHNDSTKNKTHNIVAEPTVHETGKKTYTVEIYHRDDEHVGSPPQAGYIERVNVGAFKPPTTTAGDRTDGEENPGLYSGIAPNVGLVGLSGYLKTRRDLQHLAEDFSRLFNLRALAIKLGFDNSPGIAGGNLSEGSIEAMKALAEAGVLPVSRTANSQYPAWSDSSASLADETITVVQAGPQDGISSVAKNEPAAIDEDGEGVYLKPDVTALGNQLPPWETVKGALVQHFRAAFRAEQEQPPIRDYEQFGGFVSGAQVSFVAGTAGLIAQALEEEAPAGVALPPPEEAGIKDTMRLKQTILATASETPFTAAPWHKREPSYDFGGHDPVEGWGRVNIDAGVEAAVRDLTPGVVKPPNARSGGENSNNASKRVARDDRSITTVKESVGLALPEDSRAVAGHISGHSKGYEVALDFSHYTGSDKGRAIGPPHLDLFVYDAENPGKHGIPNIVTKAQGSTGSASVQFSADQSTSGGSGGKTYYVVAKLVNVPGAYNSLDIQAQFDLSVERI